MAVAGKFLQETLAQLSRMSVSEVRHTTLSLLRLSLCLVLSPLLLQFFLASLSG
jgi:hypothetical protein